MSIAIQPGLNAEQSANSFTDGDLESMAHGNNPQSNAYRELLARRHQSVDYLAAIDVLRKSAARELDGGYHTHHNALIYAANRLENELTFEKGVNREP